MIYEWGISPKIHLLWGMSCEGRGCVKIVMHGYSTVGMDVLGEVGHKNKVRTLMNGRGGEEIDALRTRVTRTINITKWVKKKNKKSKTHTTNYHKTNTYPYHVHWQKETNRERLYGAKA